MPEGVAAAMAGAEWLFVFAYLETRWQALSGSGGSSPGGVFSCWWEQSRELGWGGAKFECMRDLDEISPRERRAHL